MGFYWNLFLVLFSMVEIVFHLVFLFLYFGYELLFLDIYLDGFVFLI